MSGLELLGVVLAGFPMMVGLLEKYSKGVETVENMLNLKLNFNDAMVRLDLCDAKFRHACEHLLKDRSPESIQSLIMDRKGWDDPEVKLYLQGRLGRDSTLFLRALKSVDKRVAILGKKLGLPDVKNNQELTDEMAKSLLDKVFFSRSKRITRGFNWERYSKLVEGIVSDVEKLSELALRARTSAIDVRARSSSINPGPWLAAQKHTARIFDALCGLSMKACRESHTHRMKFRLDTHSKSQAGSKLDAVHFNYAFLATTDHGEAFPHIGCMSTWRNVEVFPGPSAHDRFSTKTKTVSFVQSSSGRSQSQKSTSPPPCALRTPLRNLCLAPENGCEQGQCLGLLQTADWCYHVHHERCRKVRLNPLSNILGRSSRNMATRQKRTLALKLALGVLQLHDTPWLNDDWTTDDILFDSKSNLPHTIKDPLYSRNWVVYKLAIALIELHYGTALKHLCTPSDGQDGEALTEMRCAVRLVKDIEDNELPRFAQAVHKCVWQDPEPGLDFSLENQKFREKYFEDIVSPLMEDYNELPRIIV